MLILGVLPVFRKKEISEYRPDSAKAAPQQPQN